MKHSVTSFNTKRTLATSLKKLMEQKPLSKITVTEIIADCGLNRKTFYYHFDSIYSLLKWMLEQETFNIIQKQYDILTDYEEVILFAMDYIDANKHMLNCALDSMGREEMKYILSADFLEIMHSIVDGAEKDLGVQVTEDFKTFLCNAYSELIAGLIIDWFRNQSVRDRDQTAQYIVLLFQSSLPNTLIMASQKFPDRIPKNLH